MKIKTIPVMLFLLAAVLTGCKEDHMKTLSGLYQKDFRTEVDGKLIDLYTLTNSRGMEVCVTNYGARVVSIMVPDRNGKMQDVVCGFPTIEEYLSQKQNFGAVIGRYIGRIRDARFTLDSVEYRLMANKDTHCAHGGDPNFGEQIWQAEQLEQNVLRLSYLSLEGENGFPGNLGIHIIYKLTDNNELDVSYEAETDAPTVLNLSNHSFFNISGDLSTSVEDQILYVNADEYTPYDSTKCVTGEILPVADTPMDFRHPAYIGARIDEDFPQLKITGGYDHLWVLNPKGNDEILASRVVDPKSGRTLEVYTTEPGIQVYTANGLKGKQVGKNKIAYPKRSAVCLETMHFQDSPNQPQFPSTVLRPGDTFRSHTVYRFGVVQ